ncbi:hypothetical protein GIB67_017934 [Kingdonia uniflora]|uniref:DUF4216 domain-containing protein n=1 Tax=Kingdonia uniflora TaxID=39325 RepID=A0A7J7NEQ1_9MAGN|nr:hypothetical protein GIB67_017934 [Kingdonia uniflora]
MMYYKEYINDGAKGNNMRGLRTFGDYDDECAKPLDKKGKYNTYKENLNSRSQSRRGNHRTKKPIDYVSWLRQQLKNDEDYSFKKLMDGPSFKAISYKSYQVNGYVFYTSESEKHKTAQNSGVSMRAVTSFISRVGDRNPINEEVTYYGIDDDEPFILASQATQVFYCKDHSRPDEQWHVVLDSPKRLSKDVDAYEDPLVFAERINVDDSILSLVDDVAEDNIIEDAKDALH